MVLDDAVFQLFDPTNTGSVAAACVHEILAAGGLNVTAAEVREALACVLPSGSALSDTVTVAVVKTAYEKLEQQRPAKIEAAEWQRLFSAVDVKRTGSINVPAFTRMLQHYGERFDRNEADHLLAAIGGKEGAEQLEIATILQGIKQLEG